LMGIFAAVPADRADRADLDTGRVG
jgi:hypothetical protein